MSRDADDNSISVKSLDTLQPLEDEDTAPREILSEQWYVSKTLSLKALAILSLVLINDDGSPTFDPAVLPWSAALWPTTLKMTAKDLHKNRFGFLRHYNFLLHHSYTCCRGCDPLFDCGTIHPNNGGLL